MAAMIMAKSSFRSRTFSTPTGHYTHWSPEPGARDSPASLGTLVNMFTAYLRMKFSTNAYPMRSVPSKPATVRTMMLSGFPAMSIRKIGGLPFSTSA